MCIPQVVLFSGPVMWNTLNCLSHLDSQELNLVSDLQMLQMDFIPTYVVLLHRVQSILYSVSVPPLSERYFDYQAVKPFQNDDSYIRSNNTPEP